MNEEGQETLMQVDACVERDAVNELGARSHQGINDNDRYLS